MQGLIHSHNRQGIDGLKPGLMLHVPNLEAACIGSSRKQFAILAEGQPANVPSNPRNTPTLSPVNMFQSVTRSQCPVAKVKPSGLIAIENTPCLPNALTCLPALKLHETNVGIVDAFAR